MQQFYITWQACVLHSAVANFASICFFPRFLKYCCCENRVFQMLHGHLIHICFALRLMIKRWRSGMLQQRNAWKHWKATATMFSAAISIHNRTWLFQDRYVRLQSSNNPKFCSEQLYLFCKTFCTLAKQGFLCFSMFKLKSFFFGYSVLYYFANFLTHLQQAAHVRPAFII